MPRARSYTPWTDHEKQRLAEVWPEHGTPPTDDEFQAAFPSRSMSSIRNMRQQLGITRTAEIERMRTELQILGNGEPVDPEIPDDIGELIAKLDERGVTPDLIREVFRKANQMAEVAYSLAPSRLRVRKAYDEMMPRAVAFTGDWHVGAAFVDTDLIDRHMSLIRDTDGLDVVHMGDIVEGTTKDAKWIGSLMSIGSVGDRDFQDEMATELMRTCADKWLAVCDGNHDAHLMKVGATNHTANIAKRLDAPYFREAGGTVFLTVGTVEYVIAVKHTYRGNSRLNTTNAQRVMFGDWPEWENCDVINLAHFHFNDMHKQSRKGGSCSYFRSGTYKIHDSYSKDQGYTPEWGIPVAVFLPDQRKVYPFRGDDFEAALRFLAHERDHYARRESHALAS